MCIVHKWSKWEQYKREYSVMPGIIAPKEIRGKVYDAVDVRQRKRCLKCNKIKDVLVCENA